MKKILAKFCIGVCAAALCAFSYAQSVNISQGLIPGVFAIAPVGKFTGPRVTYIGKLKDLVDRSSYDMGSFTIPRPGLMVVLAGVRRNTANDPSITAVTIDGGAGTIHINSQPTSTIQTAVIASRAVAAGSRSVTVTTDLQVECCLIFVLLIENYQSATPSNTGFIYDGGPGGTSHTAAITVPGQSVGVFGAMTSTGGNTNASITNPTGWIVHASHNDEGTDGQPGGGFVATSKKQQSGNVTVDYESSKFASLVWASWT